MPPVAAVHPITVPTCGTTLARGQPARQSSTWSGHPAARAVNGNCNTDVVDDNHACSMTSELLCREWEVGKRRIGGGRGPSAQHPLPARGPRLAQGPPSRPRAGRTAGTCSPWDSHPLPLPPRHAEPGLSNAWWTVDLGSAVTVAGVVVKARSDCAQGCFTDLAGAQILLGSEPWTSPASLPAFTPCGVVPSKLVPGARAAVTCAAPTPARYVAVYLPKAATALALCEVDVVTA